ncbi:hypothetical protein [Salmonella phage PMBT28]|nr:hypothetical protein [Salmonella phage PMBT28]
MNITRFAVHVIVDNTLWASVSGPEHIVGQFADSIAELVTGFDGSTVIKETLTTQIVATMHNAVRQSDTRKVVIPVGFKMEVLITPMCSVMGGV